MFGLFKRNPEARALEIELIGKQIEICYEYQKFDKALAMMDKMQSKTDQFLAETNWSEDELDEFIMGRGKLRVLSDPSYASEMHVTLRRWKQSKGL